MKKKSLILLLAIAGIFSSCNDAIDIKQAGEVTDPREVFSNPADIHRGVIGVYSNLPGRNEVEFVSTFTDELSIGIANGGQGLISGEYGFFMEAGNTFAGSIWGDYYAVINRVNRLLKYTDDLIATTVNPDDDLPSLNKSKSELLVLRAYANYKLFAYFTPDYTNPSGLSIMKFDFVQTDDYNKFIGRATVAEIKDFIIDDLDAASVIMSGTQISPFEGTFYVTPVLVNVIKTKLYSLTEEYDKVIEFGELVLENPANRLANATQYASYFADNTIPREILFQLRRTRGTGALSVENVASSWYSIRVSPTGSAFYEMGRSLYNALDALEPSKFGQGIGVTRNDVRYSVNLLPTSTVNVNYESITQPEYVQSDLLFVGKYPGRPSLGVPLQNNIPVFRSADIYLAIAEARAAQGAITSGSLAANNQTVENIIYTIRRNRAIDISQEISMPTITNAQQAWKAILDERRVEFAYEGQRYLDMKRIGPKAGSSAGFERYSKDCIVNGACFLSATDHKLTLPIPSTELTANPAIRGQQNPGY